MSENGKEQKDVFDEIGLSGWHFSKLIKDVFLKSTGMELIEDKFSQDADNAFNRQISGIVILAGDNEIMITIGMSFKTASILVAYMTNMPLAEIMVEEQCDGVQEITNILAGQTKSMLSSLGSRYKYMQPFAVVGDNHHLLQKKSANSANLKFRSGAVEMVVSVTVQ